MSNAIEFLALAAAFLAAGVAMFLLLPAATPALVFLIPTALILVAAGSAYVAAFDIIRDRF
jgi:hypothetical protein